MRRHLRKALTSLSLIILVALIARLVFAWDQARKIPETALAVAPFEHETGSIAYALASGKGFSNPFRKESGPTAWLTPVYPLMVAAAFKLFGAFTLGSFFALIFVNTLFSSAVCLPLYYTGQRIASLGVGSAAAWLWALFPAAVMMPFEWIWDTSLSVFLAATLVWVTLKLADSRRWRDWVGYGLLWGLALMANPSLGSVLPVLLSWAGYRARTKCAVPLSRPASALALAVLCCLPWTVRNFVVFHRLVPLRSNFPLELYIGNNENYDDRRPRYPGPITKERELWRYFRMGEMPFMDEEMRKAKAFILAHPQVELILLGKRFVAFWTGLPHPVSAFLSADSWLVRTLMLCATFTGVGALAGLAMLARRRSFYAIPVGAFPVVFPWLYYVTHTSMRYRHPIEPMVLLLTVVALQALIGALRKAPPESSCDEAAISDPEMCD